MPSTNQAAQLSAYKKVDVETTSQSKLIVMLFNGAIQRSEEAKRQLDKGRIQGVHDNLIRAQEILGELRGALNMKASSVAANLDRIYEYLQHLLIKANINKDTKPIEEAVLFMTSLRDTWREAFEKLEQEKPLGIPVPPKINTHGESFVNLQG